MSDYKTTWREKIGYGVGAIGLDLSYGLFYSYLSYYLSSVLGLKEAFLLILTPLARIWDGINDPIMGTIVDQNKNGQIQALDNHRRSFKRRCAFIAVYFIRHAGHKALYLYSRYVYPLGNDEYHGRYSLLVYGAELHK